LPHDLHRPAMPMFIVQLAIVRDGGPGLALLLGQRRRQSCGHG
jgi:hypothetical protein